ncbi:MAG TPA: YcnI family protein [Conexibacter sp.]|jgi:uncharacterized protein YcnI
MTRSKGARARASAAAVGAVALTALALPSVAGAHVTLQPKSQPAGAFTVLDVRVPTERDNASTEKVAVQFPSGFVSVSYERVPGWRVAVLMQRLARPVRTDDGEVDEQVAQMTWTALTPQARIAPGQFQDFPISVALPDRPGVLTFKALQTYSSGEIVRWIGPPDADEPAPQVTLTAAADAGSGTGAAGGSASDVSNTGASSAGSSSDDEGGASTGLAVAGLVAGVLGLLAGGAALLASRRRTA